MILALDTDVLVHWMMSGTERHPRALDTSLAATLESCGVSKLATFNGRDFGVFSFIEVVEP